MKRLLSLNKIEFPQHHNICKKSKSENIPWLSANIAPDITNIVIHWEKSESTIQFASIPT